MGPPRVHHLFHNTISDHCFSPDRSRLAVARETNVELYSMSGNKFTLQDELRGHDKLVTGVDIAPRSGKIVTCSQDRNAYVWEPTPQGWKPTLVLLRINRAATCVRWSPDETKFAVGSGARIAAVCYFEEENDWWVSKHLKKPLRSTVTSIAWHPNSVLLGVGSTDGHARVLSAFIKGVDERPEASVWGERLPFNTVCGEYLNPTAGWVKGVAFSPSGNSLAFVSMDSTVHVVYPGDQGFVSRAVVGIDTQALPLGLGLTDVVWISEGEIICGGYDCVPLRFRGSRDGWRLVSSLDPSAKAASNGGAEREESAFNMFKQMDLKGQSKNDTQLGTVHQNTINTLRIHAGQSDGVRQISTSGVDGRVVIWDV